MKKRSILLTSVILLLCLALLCGCQRKPKMIVGELSDLNVRDDLGITLTANSGSPTALGGEFTLYNDSDDYYFHGDFHYIEKKMEDGWHTLEIDVEFVSNLLLNPLYLYDPLPLSYDWSRSYGRLPAGEYRLLEEICYIEETVNSFYVSCEFTIE